MCRSLWVAFFMGLGALALSAFAAKEGLSLLIAQDHGSAGFHRSVYS